MQDLPVSVPWPHGSTEHINLMGDILVQGLVVLIGDTKSIVCLRQDGLWLVLKLSNMYPGISAIAGPELQVFESVSEEATKILEADERQEKYE